MTSLIFLISSCHQTTDMIKYNFLVVEGVCKHGNDSNTLDTELKAVQTICILSQSVVCL